ncbi:MAG TPA: DsbA family protein [Longimicrobium sp.]|nr:DsbA family protein [Longimicrobium sp.]
MPRPAPESRRSSLTPFYVILGLVALAAVALIATKLKPASKEGANQGVAVSLTPDQLQRVHGISLGRADAPITIYEFADFQCPHCAQFAAFIEPLIRQNLVETGKARYVFYEFPLGFKWSFLSARAGRCANQQGKFWEMHGMIFGRQRQWSFDPDAAAQFVEYARTIPGMDAGKFEQCVRSDQFQKEVSESAQLGQSLGVQGTPTLFVNGRRIDPLPESYSELEAQVRRIAPDAFAGAPAAPAAAPAVPGDTAGKVTGQSTQQ